MNGRPGYIIDKVIDYFVKQGDTRKEAALKVFYMPDTALYFIYDQIK